MYPIRIFSYHPKDASLSPKSAKLLALSSPPPPLSLQSSSPSPSPSPSANQIRVLVADDQALTRMVIKSMVAKAFPKVVVDMAEDGEIAVAKTDTTMYDLILMGILFFPLIFSRRERREERGERRKEG